MLTFVVHCLFAGMLLTWPGRPLALSDWCGAAEPCLHLADVTDRFYGLKIKTHKISDERKLK